MPLEGLLWFFMGAGTVIISVVVVRTIIAIIHRAVSRKQPRSFEEYIGELRQFSDELQERLKDDLKEVSELSFRDKAGALCTVKIIVDHSIELSDSDKENMKRMVERGDADAGSLNAIIAGANYEETDMHKVQNFVFSGHAAEQMRARGIELDEVVIKMLKASGRIA